MEEKFCWLSVCFPSQSMNQQLCHLLCTTCRAEHNVIEFHTNLLLLEINFPAHREKSATSCKSACQRDGDRYGEIVLIWHFYSFKSTVSFPQKHRFCRWKDKHRPNYPFESPAHGGPSAIGFGFSSRINKFVGLIAASSTCISTSKSEIFDLGISRRIVWIAQE